MPQTLERTTFHTSRLLEFFSEKELQMQIGHDKAQWPLALLKELIDHALDACETAGIAPEITVTIEQDAISVQDNGPGLRVETLERSLDYLIRVSDKSQYVSPSRGQLGNALKCVWAAPYVVSGESGHIEVTTGGLTHVIDVTLNRIEQRPDIQHSTRSDGLVKNGTLMSIVWPGVAGYKVNDGWSDFYNAGFRRRVDQLLMDYAAFNPHATFHQLEDDSHPAHWHRVRPEWRKWLPRDPTSPHWYTVERLRGLIAAYLSEEQHGTKARTVREFVSEFRGLSSTVKQKVVTERAGLSGAYLHDLVEGNDVALQPITTLLTAMKEASREVRPSGLGVLGQDYLAAHLIHRLDVEPDSFKYRKVEGYTQDLPFVLEVGFGWYRASEETQPIRYTMTGLNWTPTLTSPLDALGTLLGEARVDPDDPVVVLVHLACPRLDFMDRGKSRLALSAILYSALKPSLKAVTKTWTKMKLDADKQQRVSERQKEHGLKAQQRQFLSVKEAAYRKACGRLRLANARQIIYAARPSVLELTGGKSWKNSSYFTQVLLPNFLESHAELTADWDVVFDDRGHFIEPHTEHRIGLGTLAVRHYIRNWHADIDVERDSITLDHDVATMGPANRFRFALFIEKEGFDPMVEAARIADRFDIAPMSTKGMSVTAARQLVEKLSEQGVTILVCHDFDKSGFSILRTLRSDTRRYRFMTEPKVVDLGLRLADVQAMDLASEPVDYRGSKDPRINLRRSGATDEECNFLVQRTPSGRWTGQRVELNAMTSDPFIAWLEGKLTEAGVEKVIPNSSDLAKAYRRAVWRRRVQAAIDEALGSIDEDEEVSLPDDLEAQLREKLTGSAQSWDQVLWKLIADEEPEA